MTVFLHFLKKTIVNRVSYEHLLYNFYEYAFAMSTIAMPPRLSIALIPFDFEENAFFRGSHNRINFINFSNWLNVIVTRSFDYSNAFEPKPKSV